MTHKSYEYSTRRFCWFLTGRRMQSYGRQILFCFLLAVLISALSSTSVLAQGRTEKIAEKSQGVVGSGNISTFDGGPIINDAGEVAFSATLVRTNGGFGDNKAIYRGNGLSLNQIVRKGQSVSGSGTYNSFGDIALNNLGQVAFSSVLSNTSGGTATNEGIFLGGGGAVSTIVRKGNFAQDRINNNFFNGTFSVFNDFALNNNGQVAFHSELVGTSGGTSDNEGIFLSDGGTPAYIARRGRSVPDNNGIFESFRDVNLNGVGQVTFISLIDNSTIPNDVAIFRSNNDGSLNQIARKNQSAPGGSGTYFSFDNPIANRFGQVSFLGRLPGNDGGLRDGIFLVDGQASSRIAFESQFSPDGNGVFSSLQTHSMNDNAQVLFTADLINTTEGESDNFGIFRNSGSGLVQIAREGQFAPGNDGKFINIGTPSNLNNSGQAVFTSELVGASGGTGDNSGIFTSDGFDLFEIVREGDVIGSSTVSSFEISDDSLNENGQVAYKVVMASGNEMIRRWTPDLRWRSTTSGNWSNSNRWTLGLDPNAIHDVSIDSDANVVVNGPTAATVRSLQIGGGNGIVTLDMQAGGKLTTENGLNIHSTGRLAGTGTIFGSVTNNGTIQAQNLNFDLGLINVNGVVQGNGRITGGTLINQSGGAVRAGEGEKLWIDAGVKNSGVIEAIEGEVRFSGSLNNNPGTGLITGRDATFRFDSSLVNSGSMGISFGTSDIFGDINNRSTGVINLSGGANVTFYDDFEQNGTLTVAKVGDKASTAVFFGEFSGDGGFVGGGNVFAFGDMRVGNSPASVLMDGNLFLGTTTNSEFEFQGTEIGEFDQWIVTGDLEIAGGLSILELDGFQFELGQEFLIAEVGINLTGRFDGLDEGDLVGNFGGTDLFISYQAGDGNDVALFTAVPEPDSLVVLAILLLMVLLSRRRGGLFSGVSFCGD